MTFDEADEEIRTRLAESAGFLAHLRTREPRDFAPVEDLQKALRAHWLVSIYAAFERGVNAVVEASLAYIAGVAPQNDNCVPALHSLIHHAKIKSIRDCSNGRVFDVSVELFASALGAGEVDFPENPLSERLQNVDAGTIVWVMSLFGAAATTIPQSNIGRLSNLRERRNAIAHGRESAVTIGQRYTIDELARLYGVVDEELTRMSLGMREFCRNQRFLKRVA